MNKLLLPSRILNHKIISVQNVEKIVFVYGEISKNNQNNLEKLNR
jgi:hypothetical protein